jgi:hypothetical protein
MTCCHTFGVCETKERGCNGGCLPGLPLATIIFRLNGLCVGWFGFISLWSGGLGEDKSFSESERRTRYRGRLERKRQRWGGGYLCFVEECLRKARSSVGELSHLGDGLCKKKTAHSRMVTASYAISGCQQGWECGKTVRRGWERGVAKVKRQPKICSTDGCTSQAVKVGLYMRHGAFGACLAG